jgi:hypothetical protein
MFLNIKIMRFRSLVMIFCHFLVEYYLQTRFCSNAVAPACALHADREFGAVSDFRCHLIRAVFKRFTVAVGIVGCILFFNGCESLPAGDPPNGPIVDTSMPESRMFSIDQAVNYMTTSLSTVCIQHGLRGVAVLKPFSDTYSNKVFRQVADISGIVAATGTARSELLLTSKFIKHPGNMIWEMRLIRLNGNKVIWNSKTTIKTPNP